MIDTLTYAKKLENVGFTKEQAEALIMLSSDLSFHHLATKEEIRRLSAELKGEMNQLGVELRSEMNQLGAELRSEMNQLSVELRSEMKQLKTEVQSDMQSLENRLTVRLGLMMGTMCTILFAALTLVIHLK